MLWDIRIRGGAIRVKIHFSLRAIPRIDFARELFFIFVEACASFVSSDFGRTRRTSHRGNRKSFTGHDELFLPWKRKTAGNFPPARRIALLVCVHVYVRVCISVCTRGAYSCVDVDAGIENGDEKGVGRARSRNECGKAVGSSSKPEATQFQGKKEGLNSGWGKWAS